MSGFLHTRAAHISGAALFILILWVVISMMMPAEGFWGIDGGLKVLAASSIAEQKTLDYSLPDTDSGLTGSNDYLPYVQPFVFEKESQIKTVFSPLYQIILAVLWKLDGIHSVRLFSLFLLLLTIPILSWFINVYFPGKNRDLSTYYLAIPLWLATPMFFYSFVIWEYQIIVLIIFIALILRKSDSYYSVFLSGFTLALTVALRPEALFLLIAFLFYSRKSVLKFIYGVVPGLLVMLLLENAVNGTFLPQQWIANISTSGFNFSSIWKSIFFQTGLLSLKFGWIFLIIATGILILSLFKNEKFGKYSSFLIILFYAGIYIYRLISPVKMGNLAEAGGILAVVPLFLLWIFNRNGKEQPEIKRLLIIFTLLVLLFNPVPQGIHWGARMMIPGVVLGTFMFIITPSDKSKYAKASKVILISLAILMQTLPLHILIAQKRDNAEMRQVIENLDETSPIVLSTWYQGGDLGPSLKGKAAYFPKTQNSRLELISIFRSAGIKSFYFLSPGRVEGLPGGSRLIAEGKSWHLLEYYLSE